MLHSALALSTLNLWGLQALWAHTPTLAVCSSRPLAGS